MSTSEAGNSLPEFLAERARASSDTRLAVDAIAGLVFMITFSFWRIPAWYLLVAIGACFLFYGTWAIAGRELAEGTATRRERMLLRALSTISAAVGLASAAFLMLAVVAKLIGRVIS
jgi:hypothetical protein